MKDPIIMVQGVVEDYMANVLVAQMLYPESVHAEKPIKMFINSGGSVTAVWRFTIQCNLVNVLCIHMLWVKPQAWVVS